MRLQYNEDDITRLFGEDEIYLTLEEAIECFGQQYGEGVVSRAFDKAKAVGKKTAGAALLLTMLLGAGGVSAGTKYDFSDYSQDKIEALQKEADSSALQFQLYIMNETNKTNKKSLQKSLKKLEQLKKALQDALNKKMQENEDESQQRRETGEEMQRQSKDAARSAKKF